MFAIAGKLTGYDALVIRGQAKQRSVLTIDSEGTDLIDAAALSGLSAKEADERLKKRLGPVKLGLPC